MLEAADRLGYRPNLMARSLVQGRTRSIGLLVTDCTHPFYATLIRAVEEVAFEAGFSLAVDLERRPGARGRGTADAC